MTQVNAGSRPIRVLHLRDSPWVDGPGRTILETAKRIDRSRVDYHVGAFVSRFSEPHPLVDTLREHGLPVHAIEDRGGVGREIVNSIVDLLDRLQIDILHTSELRSNVLALLCRRRRPGLRLVSTAHGWIANDIRGSSTHSPIACCCAYSTGSSSCRTPCGVGYLRGGWQTARSACCTMR